MFSLYLTGILWFPNFAEFRDTAPLRKPFEVTKMTQSNFLDWKGHLDQKYKLEKKDVSGNPWRLRDVHWLNFGWGQEIDKATGETVLQYHPGKVWMKKKPFQRRAMGKG